MSSSGLDESDNRHALELDAVPASKNEMTGLCNGLATATRSCLLEGRVSSELLSGYDVYKAWSARSICHQRKR